MDNIDRISAHAAGSQQGEVLRHERVNNENRRMYTILFIKDIQVMLVDKCICVL